MRLESSMAYYLWGKGLQTRGRLLRAQLENDLDVILTLFVYVCVKGRFNEEKIDELSREDTKRNYVMSRAI